MTGLQLICNDLEEAHSPRCRAPHPYPRLYVLHWTVAYRLTLPYEFDSQHQLACKHKQLRLAKLTMSPKGKKYNLCFIFLTQ